LDMVFAGKLELSSDTSLRKGSAEPHLPFEMGGWSRATSQFVTAFGVADPLATIAVPSTARAARPHGRLVLEPRRSSRAEIKGQ